MNTELSTEIRPGTYTIDSSRSTCSLVVTHAFGLMPVNATVAISGGTVTLTTDPARYTASATLAAASFNSGSRQRDRDVTKRFLNAARYPQIAFRSTGINDRRITGVLSVRGTDSPVTLNITSWAPTENGYHALATTEIDRITAGVKAGRGMVARKVRFTLEVVVSAS
ncbi:YceI family protein [Streptomyces sp. NPDC058683]|uniref:YceI family protein n=1 Tax=Streptomyces sp. NPDC058683 TaxID=3346597 RepID=UPI00364A1892